MDRGAWPFSVGEVICLVNSVSVCKKRREEKRRKKSEEKIKRSREDEDEREDEREEREEERKNDFVAKCLKPEKPPDELSHNDSKNKTFRTNFSFESSESYPCFQLFP